MPLSRDPEARARQLANLKSGERSGNLIPGQGAEAGKAARTSHGAYSERLVADVNAEVRELLEALSDAAPVRAVDGGLPAHDVIAVERAARLLRRYRAVENYLDLHGLLDEKGNVRPAAELSDQLGASLDRVLAALGMTPAARAKLGVDLARSADLASWMSDGADDDAIEGSVSDDG